MEPVKKIVMPEKQYHQSNKIVKISAKNKLPTVKKHAKVRPNLNPAPSNKTKFNSGKNKMIGNKFANNKFI